MCDMSDIYIYISGIIVTRYVTAAPTAQKMDRVPSVVTTIRYCLVSMDTNCVRCLVTAHVEGSHT
jgi:hypothetical protein